MVEASSTVGTMEAPSLYDVVKKQIYALWLECLLAQRQINKQRVQAKQDDYNYENDFKAGVMALWRAIEFKLDYHPDTDCVRALKKFDEQGIFKGTTEVKLETLEEAFKQMTAFLEKNGVTRFETKRARSDLEIIEGLDEPGDF